MAQQLEAVLSQAQRDSLELTDFIFHIIDPDAGEDDRVVYLDEVQLTESQRSFFLERLQEAAQGTQYVFKQDAVHLQDKCLRLRDDVERFVEVSRQITADFAGRHRGQMSAGVFIVSKARFLISAHRWGEFAFLVKMDKQPSISYQYQVIGGRKVATLQNNDNALIESKKAIQKSALINVSEHFAWHVLAFDKQQNPGLTDYFRGFLGVTERQEASALTRLANSTVRKWAKDIPQEDLPEGEDFNTMAGRAFNYLKDRDQFDTDEFVNTVVRCEDPEKKESLTRSLREKLAESGVAGQQFRPQPNSLPKRERKQVYQTDEGVIISFEGTLEEAGITKTDLGNGRVRLSVETNRLTIKA